MTTYAKIVAPSWLEDMFKAHPDLPFRRKQMEDFFEEHFDELRNQFLPRNQCDMHGFSFSEENRIPLYVNLLILCYNKVVLDPAMTGEMEKFCSKEAIIDACGERLDAVQSCRGTPTPVPEEEWPHLLHYARLTYVVNRYIFTVANCCGTITHTICDMLGTTSRRHKTGSRSTTFTRYREVVQDELCGMVRIPRQKRKFTEVDPDAATIADNGSGATIPSFTLQALVLAAKKEADAATREIACQTEPEEIGCYVSAADFKRLQQLKAMFGETM